MPERDNSRLQKQDKKKYESMTKDPRYITAWPIQIEWYQILLNKLHFRKRRLIASSFLQTSEHNSEPGGTTPRHINHPLL